MHGKFCVYFDGCARVMKRFVLVFFVILLSCNEESKSDCFKIGGSKAECEANDQCVYNYLGVGVLVNDEPVTSFASLIANWEERKGSTHLAVGVCLNKPDFHSDEDCCLEFPDGGCCELKKEKWRCYFIGENFYLFKLFDKYEPQNIPPGWVPCVSLVLGREPIECGNGVIEPGEQCDGDQLGTMPSCAEHQAAVHPAFAGDAIYTEGTITCTTGCSWDFSDCVSAE